MDFIELENMIRDKDKTVLSKHTGKYWVLHVCKNGVLIPLFHSEDIRDIKGFLERGDY